MVEQAKNRVEAQLDRAKSEYKEAYETGDPDKLIEAQEKLTALQNEKFRVESYKPKPQPEVKEVPEPLAKKQRFQSQTQKQRRGRRKTNGLAMTQL